MNARNTIFTVLGIIVIGLIIFFMRDRITGYQIMSTRLVVSVPEPTICNISFEEGWNLVSFPCIADDININIFFGNSTFQYASFRAYDAQDNVDPWKSYNPELPNWTVQDSLLSRRKGYWVYVEDHQDVIINSSLGTPSIITLSPGWNLMGYPSRTVRPANDTFSTLEPNFEYVYMYNASETIDKWRLYKLNSSYPGTVTLNYTTPNYGYWIYMTAADSVIIT